ncbi:histidine kinase [Rhodobacterales bacterium]|nr:histidine kinase [Rhodobacterales bacterium]
MRKHIPLLVFLISAAIGLSLTYTILQAERIAEHRGFEILANEAVDRIRQRIEHNFSLITATHSFFDADEEEITRRKFQSFALGLFLKGQLSGMQGIGFAELIAADQEDAASAALSRNYELDRRIWPETGEDLRTPIVLLEPLDIRNKAALGFDMFSEAVRRKAIRNAASSFQVSASAPVMLVQEITDEKQAGFLAYLPLKARDGQRGVEIAGSVPVTGFIFAPFRAGDLHKAALTLPTPVSVLVRTVDVTDGEPELLFESSEFAEKLKDAENSTTEQLDVGGRTWDVTVIESAPKSHTFLYWRTFILGFVSLLFSAALAVSVRSQMNASEANRRLKQVSEKALQDKDLMLQEMKHRIKNSIARILAIARQTANAAEDLESFSNSFTSRLQAMANAQDLLTRSAWQKADLRALLTQELEQVFGSGAEKIRLDGPDVLLNEACTHALGLVFHELATNAMKYSDAFDDGGTFEVVWRVVEGEKKRLELDWIESSSTDVVQPETLGFGSRLMQALVAGEMSGSINRRFSDTGIEVNIRIPLD